VRSLLRQHICVSLTEHQGKQNRQCAHKRNIKARSCNHCCSGKSISITYYECVSIALGIQHAMRMRHTARLHHIFPHYLRNGKSLGKTLKNKKMCVLIFSTNLFETIVILRRILRDMMMNVYWSS
jgi:hypothetical protein